MNAKIKAKWVAALRSGKFKQGIGQLISEDRKKFCCLGVLCELHRRITHGDEWSQTGFYFGRSGALPDEVKKWAGLESQNPLVEGTSLANWNDGSTVGFRGIANRIEKHL